MEVNDEILNVSWVFTKTSLPKYIHIFLSFFIYSLSLSLCPPLGQYCICLVLISPL